MEGADLAAQKLSSPIWLQKLNHFVTSATENKIFKKFINKRSKRNP